ncbi:MAG: transporter substrate-binding domain-containing protein [Alphaproteobacteria bacterium]|nr:transporter substrate-binding domain-containing protein [Alphaproteobacteria bacterium]
MKKLFAMFFIVFVCSLLGSFGETKNERGKIVEVSSFVFGVPAAHAGEKKEKEGVYDRVMRTGKVRCGYVVIDPTFIKDPNTGAFSGIVYELMEEIGSILDLDIEWTEEVSFGTAIAGLRAGRYDAICSSLYARPNVMKDLELTEPYYFVPINVYVRKGDRDRFQTYDDLNKPDVKISYMDGTIPALIKRTDFPSAGSLALPDFNYSDILLGVSTGKADVTFVEPSIALAYMDKNPDTLELLPALSPVRFFPNVFGVLKGEHDLNTMLSWAIRYLQYNGQIEAILQKYERYPGSFVRVSKAYVMPE